MEIENRTTPIIPVIPVIPVIPAPSVTPEITPIPRYDNVDKSVRTVPEQIPILPTRRYSECIAPGTVKYFDYGYYDEDEEKWIVLKTVPIYPLRKRPHHFVGKEVINFNETD